MGLVIDRGKILELVSWDKELLSELIRLFKQDVPDFMRKIESGIASEDYELVHIAAHRVKGQLRNFFADEMAKKAEIVECLGGSTNEEEALIALEELKSGIPQVIEALELLLLDCP